MDAPLQPCAQPFGPRVFRCALLAAPRGPAPWDHHLRRVQFHQPRFTPHGGL